MILRQSCTAVLAGLVSLAGCGGQWTGSAPTAAATPPGYVAPKATESLPLADHPEYANWSRFPVGTVVVRSKEVTNDQGTVRVTTTLRLAANTSDKVTVETQVTVDRMGHPLIENPPLRTDFPASFRVPAGMRIEQFTLPSLKAKLVGPETRQVGGQEWKTQLFTWQEVNETGPMTVKLWRSDEAPGRLVRQEITGPEHDSVEDVIEISVPSR